MYTAVNRRNCSGTVREVVKSWRGVAGRLTVAGFRPVYTHQPASALLRMNTCHMMRAKFVPTDERLTDDGYGKRRRLTLRLLVAAVSLLG